MDKESPGQAGVIKTLMEVLGIYVLITFAASWASIRAQIVVKKLPDAIQAGGRGEGRGWLKGSLPDPSLIQVGHLGPGVLGSARGPQPTLDTFPCLGCSITFDLFFLEGSRISAALGWSKLWLLYPEPWTLVLTDHLSGGF